MKKTRLLEIIREEISGALNEKTALGAGALGDPDFKKAFSKLPGDEKAKVTKGLQSGTETFVFEEEKRKKLAEKYQIDEDTINEMASVVQTKKALTKLGDEKGLELVKDVEKETLDQFKKNPRNIEGRLARELEPNEYPNKKPNKKTGERTIGYGAEFERNFKKKAGIDFKDFTMDIELKFNKQFPEDKKFNSGLATNTTEKDAAAQIFGLEKGVRGRKADPNKPEKAPSTGKRGRPAGPSNAGKAVTLTPGDDGFDDVSYSEPEEDEAAAAVGSDETAKELGQAASVSKDENFDRIRTGLMKKAKAAKGELSAADAQLANQIINTAKAKYKFNATQVDALRAVAGL
jgi:hypothetical protein